MGHLLALALEFRALGVCGLRGLGDLTFLFGQRLKASLEFCLAAGELFALGGQAVLRFRKICSDLIELCPLGCDALRRGVGVFVQLIRSLYEFVLAVVAVILALTQLRSESLDILPGPGDVSALTFQFHLAIVKFADSLGVAFLFRSLLVSEMPGHLVGPPAGAVFVVGEPMLETLYRPIGFGE